MDVTKKWALGKGAVEDWINVALDWGKLRPCVFTLVIGLYKKRRLGGQVNKGATIGFFFISQRFITRIVISQLDRLTGELLSRLVLTVGNLCCRVVQQVNR
jgi:hypothetical protein